MHSVCMQAQRLKNDKTKLYKACKELRTKLRFGLTGTPMQNKHSELYILVHLCAPLSCSLLPA